MFPLDGKKIAEEILDRLGARPVPKKFLAGVIIGDDPASISFQNIKKRTAEKLGVDYRIYRLDPELGNDSLRREVGKIAAHKTCGGVIVQLPLPEDLGRHYVMNAIPREKDPDVLGERALGAFYAGRSKILPPSVTTLSSILARIYADETRINAERSDSPYLKSLAVAVIGTGFLIGRPIVHWLMDKVKELIILGKRSDLSILQTADLVVTGTGVPGLVKPEMLKDGASVIDFGYGKVSEKRKAKSEKLYSDTEELLLGDESPLLVGDFDSSLIAHRSSLLASAWYTPTPGGTGPILVAKLFENFYQLNN
ncbi:MAG: bifunctional 5,10-methylenetetrahydrofolate dehydrogenase/5,10-methenyltetrahydrofolate cyclohydrolase [Candidatus Liptonbacteria bacterium]|nr:bifunctional 5,10-methylenetetrahydrofolate dehydrogenase/5,10-methenyltetrahydrofolate cyclohydrolase [Candidatus Liptonbacteria bacterium]